MIGFRLNSWICPEEFTCLGLWDRLLSSEGVLLVDSWLEQCDSVGPVTQMLLASRCLRSLILGGVALPVESTPAALFPSVLVFCNVDDLSVPHTCSM